MSMIRWRLSLGAQEMCGVMMQFLASYCSRILFLKDGKIFHELVRGVEERREFLNKILDVLSLTGGELSDVR